MPKNKSFWRDIKASYLVNLFRKVHWYRQQYACDGKPVSMVEVWRDLASQDYDDTDEFRTTLTIYNDKGLKPTKGGVVAFAGAIRLIVSESFWRLAKKKAMLQNFTLAHEFAHVFLDHHRTGAVVKNYKLIDANGVLGNRPPTWEEFEANIAAVFFQCGVDLFDPNKSAIEIAEKFSSDPYCIERLQRVCQLDEFQRIYLAQQKRIERVVL